MLTVQEAACALAAGWNGENVLFTGVSTDSRTIKHGDLFVALSGERFDGHQFIASAIDQGAVAVLVGKKTDIGRSLSGFGWIQVSDTRLSLGQLSAYWRTRFSLPLVAVTGSNGKTTVKEMIASIFRKAIMAETDEINSTSDKVLATIGNLNNDIGVPQMLLRLREQHAYAVIEMGMNHAGEIAYLTRLAKPTVAVITNAGAAHIEGLGSVEAVARAKGEIFEGLSDRGVAIINVDDDHASLWRRLAENRHIIDFGLNGSAQVTAFYQSDSSKSRWVLKLPDGSEEIRLQVPGQHNIYNALAAAATAVAVGIDKQTIAAGLQAFRGVQGRLQKKLGLHKATLIDDTYNANPESMRAALAVLANEPGKKVLILGDMGELGPNAADFHHQIGVEASHVGIDELLTLGNLSKHAAVGFGRCARHFSSMDALLVEAEKLLDINVSMLVKGSRFMQMERVIRQLEA
ncbi:UDP-N-acetylmuramoyl-tripeptide--D-alanyl-D-alanine ligase [Nitrosomonas sp. Is37]|uniref:UDP-N-acetylmuramoyl-tripeptide--D-alanyl-D- alanine ligase n=1 Tax=Nitrosomonas sp. Is37 TaxID=3080535 RepID=UPI00294B940D|nr:UDP-N-acetylmuramoyl-tripeptide--D-alanyl-D-alanine ligase [Nitrosomonas sp. Is37]MDV6344986.1 UDP-N-acetylmuramoyl-tripeptide--D-alanyl-D-alanine ligase [Nitrosomonas sp. Is37]